MLHVVCPEISAKQSAVEFPAAMSNPLIYLVPIDNKQSEVGMVELYDNVSAMEPMMPSEPMSRELEDMAVDVHRKASALAGRVHPSVALAIGDLVRSMNCYYSNLIEGHDTHPRDIDRALAEDFSVEESKRNLQKEAKAHITVQRMIDEGALRSEIVSKKFICEIHERFYVNMPESFCQVGNPDTGEQVRIVPGAIRAHTVSVGRHVPPSHDALENFLGRFATAYLPDRLSKTRQVVAAAASHHRLLWIHPFVDGNGRVARLFSHAYLREIDVGSSLWSVSRGLARHHEEYKRRLARADMVRQGDWDGRGNLSHDSLIEFCRFFLLLCIDQMDFMSDLLELGRLLPRMEAYVQDEVREGRLPGGAFVILREVIHQGEVRRGNIGGLIGRSSRHASTILKALTEAGLLASDGPKKPVRIAFPSRVVDAWFPRLYPAELASRR